jgi:transposase
MAKRELTLGEAIAKAAAERAEAHERLVNLCREAVARGVSLRQIEKVAGVSYATVHRWMSPKMEHSDKSGLDQPL